jgi:hypothetical protein
MPIVSGNDWNVAGGRNPSALFQMALLRVEGWVSLFEGYFVMVDPPVAKASQ